MTISEIMKIGTQGMTPAELAAEQERRLRVARRLEHMNKRQIQKIKREESAWLKQAAWFLY